MWYEIEYMFCGEDHCEGVGRHDLYVQAATLDGAEARLAELLQADGTGLCEDDDAVELRGLVTKHGDDGLMEYCEDIVYSMDEVCLLMETPCRKLVKFTTMVVKQSEDGTRKYKVPAWVCWGYPEELPLVVKEVKRLATIWEAVGWAVYRAGKLARIGKENVK